MATRPQTACPVCRAAKETFMLNADANAQVTTMATVQRENAKL